MARNAEEKAGEYRISKKQECSAKTPDKAQQTPCTRNKKYMSVTKVGFQPPTAKFDWLKKKKRRKQYQNIS